MSLQQILSSRDYRNARMQPLGLLCCRPSRFVILTNFECLNFSRPQDVTAPFFIEKFANCRHSCLQLVNLCVSDRDSFCGSRRAFGVSERRKMLIPLKKFFKKTLKLNFDLNTTQTKRFLREKLVERTIKIEFTQMNSFCEIRSWELEVQKLESSGT